MIRTKLICIFYMAVFIIQEHCWEVVARDWMAWKSLKVFTIWSFIEKSVNSYFRRKHAQDGKNKKDNQILVGPQEFNYRKRRKKKKNINGGGELTGMTAGNLANRIQIHILILSWNHRKGNFCSNRIFE